MELSLPTRDGVTRIAGQIDLPPRGEGPFAAVLLVPGTGPFDRDVHFQASGTPPAKGARIFQALSEALVSRGIAVVRSDKRGILCNPLELEDASTFLEQCVEDDVYRSVTPETIRDDIALVYEHIASWPMLDRCRVAILAHSEGSIHVARLLEEGNLQPQPSAVVLMSGLARSPAEVMHWQQVDRAQRDLTRCDGDGDSVLTPADLAECRVAGVPACTFFEGLTAIRGPESTQISCEHDVALDDSSIALDEAYDVARRRSLAAPDDAPFGKLASMAWWKMWFADDVPVIDRLVGSGFEGIMAMHYGMSDYQLSVPQEVEAIERYAVSFPGRLTIVLHDGVGHTLGPDPIYGPMDPHAEDQLLDDVERSLLEPRCSP